MSRHGGVLSGLRVLLVEDEMLVSLLIEDMLADMGCIVVGPHDRVDRALVAARAERIDIALLDVNVGGEKVYPVAEILAARHVPLLFISGYGQGAIPPEHPEWRACTKPFRADDLMDMMVAQIRAG